MSAFEIVMVQAAAELVARVLKRSNPPTAPAVDPRIQIIEAERREEIIGEDPPYRLDNRQSSADVTQTINARRSWKRQCTVQLEAATTTSLSTGGGVERAGLSLKLEQSIEDTLRRSYSVVEEHEETFEQTVTANVPAGVASEVTLVWKRVWQLGIVIIETDEVRVEVPYKTLAGVVFDQIHRTGT